MPSYLHAEGLTAEVEGLGEIVVDVAYGGNFYAIVEPQAGYGDLDDLQPSEVIRFSGLLRQAFNARHAIVHPENPALDRLTHVMWTGAPRNGGTARNAVFYGDKAIDRSPCGTGTSARMAQWYAKGKLKQGDLFIHESIIGSQFIGRVEGVTTVGSYPAIIPSVEGWARVYGHNTITIDDEDPYAFGFQVI